ncbi:hypothetical protein DV096_01055 [Bradymonadaceae bacterium TMQ3]|uniref:Uncharacterized protein n=1 Tax=Lujinxingia sediminis TaxID=2480984 RepID=A0ABY0CYR3_9DELT|nr:hypothetical protein [Lujinxingia sediminis]RDV39191.1 hypothetical protein DV096_01055 [Bradymonadaceae bacterium TMQ3]RVU48769.1 hypothetical protein EA187_04880 [Lujinxingia sediminis]TXC78062.1 hypothetical protein FRC91_04845 [Bradymonadales bacterium TMQ1]
MSKSRSDYDATQKLIRVYPTFDSPKTLVPREELSAMGVILQAGKDEEGREVEAIRYVFNSPESAVYNQQALSFMKFETYVDQGDGERPVDGEDPEFAIREDFGIDD